MMGKWYTTRNTPGGPGNQSEWTLFTRCLLTMMGYDIGRLALTNKVVQRFLPRHFNTCSAEQYFRLLLAVATDHYILFGMSLL